MGDLAAWDVHGPVETLRTELQFVRFRPDGRVLEQEFHNGDGSVSRTRNIFDDSGQLIETRWQTDSNPAIRQLCSYDDAGRPTGAVTINEDGERYKSETCHYDSNGRKIRIQFPPKLSQRQKEQIGTALFVAGPGENTITTYFDDHDQPAEILFHNPSHVLVRREIFTRDGAGRVLKHEVRPGEGAFQSENPEHARALRTILSQQIGFPITTYTYDEKGRQVEKRMRMSGLSEEHTTYVFDDHDNPIEENALESSREARMDEQGGLHPTKETSSERHRRYTYSYDPQGNWTERIIWSLPQDSADFPRSAVERRQITYYSEPS